MNEAVRSVQDRLASVGLLVAGVLIGGLGILAAYGLECCSFPAVFWRDHPFDFANIQFTWESISLRARLWEYDPHHLFGWTPNVFYNPLATFASSLFVGLCGGSEGAYRLWLLLVLFGTALAFLPLLPGKASLLARVTGGLIAAWMSLLVYPMDVGLLDVNPVQVIYTGQWAQRLGVALGLLSLERFWRAHQLLDRDLRRATQRALAATMLLGASLFTHYMSGVASAAGMVLLSLHRLVAARLNDGGWRWRTLLIFPAMLPVLGLLFADFFSVFLATNTSHHHLPFLRWHLPEGALETVREVMLPALPLLLIPLARTLVTRNFTRSSLSVALFPLVMLLFIVLATPANLLWLFGFVLATSLAASFLEKCYLPRHWLPPVAFFLLVLSCGPDSLGFFGLDVSVLVPFHSSLGWAKFAAFSRFLFLGWLGILVVEGLAVGRDGLPLSGRLLAGTLTLAGLLIPLLISLGNGQRTGAQTFFGWMNQTDRTNTRALLNRMRGVAARTPNDGYLLVEDSLHHPEGSELQDRNLPNGHLPYLTGPESMRPVLGGAVTTRLITHPLAHTSRGQLLCTNFADLLRDPATVLDRLRALSISDILAHSPDLIRALERYPAALYIDKQAGLVHFALEHYRPVLTDSSGLHLADAAIKWSTDEVAVELPTGTSTAHLRQVWYPFLDCEAEGPSGQRACRIEAWREERLELQGCLIEDPASIEVDAPWIRLEVEPDPAGAVKVRIFSRPPLWPFLVMLLSWAAALVLHIAIVRSNSKS